MGLTSALADSSRNELRVIDYRDNFRKNENRLNYIYIFNYMYIFRFNCRFMG
jgi:hypothetical protein